MSVNQGTLYTTNVAQTANNSHDSVHGTTPDNRRLYNFGERVAELTPEESPFFVYLSKVSKVPTDDSVFRFLEDRSKTDWTDRTFLLAAAVNSSAVVAVGSSYSFTVDCDNAQAGGDSSGGASVDFLCKGMVLAVNSKTAAISDIDVSQVIVRVESAPVDAGTSTTFTGKVLSLPADSGSTDSDILDDNAKCMVIGTSFEEGSGSPDVWSGQLDDDYGYTQIFKTAAEMTNTAIATKYRGYANEWQRIWNMKLREHKVDIERAMLFSQRARSGSNQLTDGLVGHIMRTVTPTDGASAFSYSRGSSYFKSTTTGELTYDMLLDDLEVMFDPARGGSSQKLCLAGLPVISYLNKVGSGGFLLNSTTSNRVQANFELEPRQSAFGHKIMELDTIHGSLAIIKEPLFRGYASGLMLIADMNHVAYRPLVGNSINRDTHIITNVQQADEDLRKDMILTEAGLEITVPESHALYSFEGL
tara:strand:+ start:5161 stop:6579 length:1419 start_codon:yes stop_codon:yes gene_type:complete